MCRGARCCRCNPGMVVCVCTRAWGRQTSAHAHICPVCQPVSMGFMYIYVGLYIYVCVYMSVSDGVSEKSFPDESRRLCLRSYKLAASLSDAKHSFHFPLCLDGCLLAAAAFLPLLFRLFSVRSGRIGP